MPVGNRDAWGCVLPGLKGEIAGVWGLVVVVVERFCGFEIKDGCEGFWGAPPPKKGDCDEGGFWGFPNREFCVDGFPNNGGVVDTGGLLLPNNEGFPWKVLSWFITF